MAPIALEEITDDTASEPPSIYVDENGKVGVVFKRAFGSDCCFSSVLYTSNAGSTFIAPIDVIPSDVDPSLFSQYPDVQVSNGAAYVFYPLRNLSYQGNRYDLYYVKLDEATGLRAFAPVPFAQETHLYGAISFEPAIGSGPDKVHVTYVAYVGKGKKKKSELQYLVLDANTGSELFSAEKIIDVEYTVPKIAADADGLAHISYNSSEEIFYASNGSAPTGGTIHVENIDMSTEPEPTVENGWLSLMCSFTTTKARL